MSEMDQLREELAEKETRIKRLEASAWHQHNELADAREEIEHFKLCEHIPCVHEERLGQAREALEKIVTLSHIYITYPEIRRIALDALRQAK